MLTVITTTLNAGRTLERALRSRRAQTVSCQHLVIDGGSRDDTVAICRADPAVELVEAPGTSIYQAWNLGLARAGGTWIMFLNADDEFPSGALATVAQLGATDADVIAGEAEMLAEGKPAAAAVRLVCVPSGRLCVRDLALGVPAINAMAFRRSVFARHGDFPTQYRAAGDRAFLLRLALAAQVPAVLRTASTLYRYHAHAGSLTLHRSLRQRLMIADEHIRLSGEMLPLAGEARQRSVLRFWHRREAFVGFARSLAAGQFAGAGRFGLAGLRTGRSAARAARTPEV